MLKQFVFVFAIVFCVSLISFAQDKTDKVLKDPHQKMEMNKVQKVDSTKIISKEPWNKMCPVKGNEVEADSPTVEYDGKVYGFCCPGCDTKFAKNPEKYAKNLSEDGKKFVGRK
ncbi:MAG: YHS domain-containing protein [Ignavibacteriaceae bacterium]|nr:YHS domain-containing protein [Ignavibacteriaceae bacterium]HMN25137.1 YHS domain-containing protein [Ignavibacteriaceae bacterium]HRN26271.1 YHS domain-containing protein [Ignavibacteriaceae bacterium]HRP94089.1 YHS domain-containing protein [Ignavibacteriaceae bacterium]HRQ53855.1 YHS domain-containing protein [Ignavibacteriaceae bacterium]